MRRSTVINQQSNEHPKQQRKRSLEDSHSMIKSKKRRHLSPNHISKKRSSFNNSTIRTKKNSQKSRVSLPEFL
jgi:hypothetical protein